MLAESLGFTFEDWSTSDFSHFSLKVNDSTVSVKNNIVNVVIYQDSAEIGNKSFTVYRQGDQYYFSNPTSVKNWAYNFIDISDYVDVEFDLIKNSAGTVSIAAKENNVTKASASTYYRGTAYCDGPICYEEK